jgi:hypothetical protein
MLLSEPSRKTHSILGGSEENISIVNLFGTSSVFECVSRRLKFVFDAEGVLERETLASLGSVEPKKLKQ